MKKAIKEAKPYDLDLLAMVAVNLLASSPDVREGNYSTEHAHIDDAIEAAVVLLDRCIERLNEEA